MEEETLSSKPNILHNKLQSHTHISSLLVAFILPLCGSLFAAKGQSLHSFPEGEIGEFPNGFRYVVKENSEPSTRIHFRLVMGVGSMQEQSGEEGVAHFIEHLAFRNGAKFNGGKIIQHLETLGEKYGATINAYTGYDRTVYLFSVPTTTPQAVELGVDIAAQWLSSIDFTAQAVQNEKTIIMEEIAEKAPIDCFDKLKKGTDLRLQRFPTGTEKQVQRITPQVLSNFYHRNYQPQNANLIIVGANIDTEKTAQLIQKTFGRLKGNPQHRMKPLPLKYPSTGAFEAFADEYTELSSIEWIYPIPAHPALSTPQLVTGEQNRFVVAMLNTRLRKLNNPLRLSKQWYLNGTEHLCFEATSANDTLLLKQFGEGISIIGDVRRNGFSPHEIATQLKSYLESNRQCSFSWTSEQWCDHFIDILLVQSRQVSTDSENKTLTEAIAKTTLDEWNAITSRLLLPMQQGEALVGYRFHPKNKTRPKRNAISRTFAHALQSPDMQRSVAATTDCVPTQHTASNFLETPFSGTVSDSITVCYPSGVTEILLKNSARLILKQTENTDSIVMANLLFSGGLSKIPQAKSPLLESVASYMSIGGVEGVSEEEYNRVLEENSLSAITTMEAYWHGILGMGQRRNVEKLANLLFLRCFAPQKVYTDFARIKENMLVEKEKKGNIAINFMANSPERMLRKRTDELAGNVPFPVLEPSVDEIEKLNLDTIATFYNNLYTCSTGLTCIVTGNFDWEPTKQIFMAMLGRFRPEVLPPIVRSESLLSKEKSLEKVADEMRGGRLFFSDLYRGEFSGGSRQILVLKLMKEIILNRVIAEIRNNAGLIYSPYVNLYYHAAPHPRYCFEINGSVNTKNSAAVKRSIESEILLLQNKAPTQSELEAVKRSFLLAKTDFLQPDSPANWREHLSNCVKERISLADDEKYEVILHSITPEDILSAFRVWINPKQRIFLYIGSL